MNYHGILLTDTLGFGNRIRPFGAYRIASELRKVGYNMLVIDMFSTIASIEFYSLLDKFISDETLFVGYSSSLFSLTRNGGVFSKTTISLETINSYVKAINPKIKVIYGGSNSKELVRFNQKNNNNLGIDYAMHGYSEHMIVDFVNNLRDSKSQKFSNVHNKLYEIDYDYKGECYDFHNSYHEWHETDFISEGESLPLEVARGCIFKCKFCNYPLLGKNPNDMSYFKKEENLLRELTTNYEKHKTLHYFVLDDTFIERTDKIEMMLRVRDKSKLDLSFVGFNRIELLARKKEQIPLLKDLNFIGFHFGLESLNFPSAKAIGKGIQLTEILSTIDRLRTVYDDKLSITSNIIIGLPHETRDTVNAAIPMYSKELAGIDRVTFSGLVITNQTHGESEFFKNPEKYGYNILPENNGSWVSDHWSSKECEQIAKKLEDKLKYSKRTKIGPFMATGLQSLGYDFLSTANHTVIGFPWQTVNERAKQFRVDYLNKLKAL